MEVAAIAYVCDQFAVLFVVVHVIFNIGDKGAYLSFEEFLTIVA